MTFQTRNRNRSHQARSYRKTAARGQLGYVAKSAVDPAHAAIINSAMTPSMDEVREARATVGAFEAARASGKERARRGDRLVEVPSYLSARRLLARAAALEGFRPPV